MSAAAAYVCRQFVEDHLADCPHCREYLAQMRRTVALTHEVGADDVERMPDDLRDRLRRAFDDPPTG